MTVRRADSLRPRRWRLARQALRAVAIGWLVAWWIWLVSQPTAAGTDAQAYWGIRLADLYRGAHLGDQGAFLYSPIVAQVFAPLSALPYPVFYALLAAVNLGALIYLLGPELAAISLFLVPISNEIGRGNIHLLLAATIVIGFRRPVAWAWVLLTKVTPGVGLLWFAFRREWRAFGVAAASTLGLALVSYLFVPQLWHAWLAMLLSDASATRPNAILQVPVAPRLAIAAALLALGAWRNTPAIVPVAAMLALPAIWVNSLSMLVAVVPLWMGPPGYASRREQTLDSRPCTHR